MTRAHRPGATIDVAAGTIVVVADVSCPWAHLAVHRLHETRRALGLTERVVFDVRAFPLELIDRQSNPKLILDAEIPVVGALEPQAGWQVWQRPAHEWPVTLLPALEAVEAAKAQGLRASETLDRALRRAFFGESRNIAMRYEILAIAAACEGVDPDALHAELLTGGARAAIEDHLAVAITDAVRGSPHVFLPDGTDIHNPGISLRWVGRYGVGFPVVTADEPDIYQDLLRRAAG